MKTIEAPRGGYVLVRIPGEWGKGVRLYLGRAFHTNGSSRETLFVTAKTRVEPYRMASARRPLFAIHHGEPGA